MLVCSAVKLLMMMGSLRIVWGTREKASPKTCTRPVKRDSKLTAKAPRGSYQRASRRLELSFVKKLRRVWLSVGTLKLHSSR